MSQDNQTRTSEAPKASRRALLMGFAAAATPLAPALANTLSGPAPTVADPIFALIEQHKAAYGEMAALSDWPEEKDSDAAMDAAMARSEVVLLRLLTTPPVTVAGLVALLQHLSRPQWDDPDNDNILVGAAGASALKMQTAANEFPGHLAAALRSIIARGQA